MVEMGGVVSMWDLGGPTGVRWQAEKVLVSPSVRCTPRSRVIDNG